MIPKDSTKFEIVEMLSERFPVSLPYIYDKIGLKKGISYQAIHKAVKQLTKQGILEKNSIGFQINAKWINELKKFVTKLEENYNKKKQWEVG